MRSYRYIHIRPRDLRAAHADWRAAQRGAKCRTLAQHAQKLNCSTDTLYRRFRSLKAYQK